MFKTQVSRWVLIAVVFFLAFHALFLTIPASQGVYENGVVLYGWEAAGSVAMGLVWTYLIIAAIVVAFIGAYLWASKGSK